MGTMEIGEQALEGGNRRDETAGAFGSLAGETVAAAGIAHMARLGMRHWGPITRSRCLRGRGGASPFFVAPVPGGTRAKMDVFQGHCPADVRSDRPCPSAGWTMAPQPPRGGSAPSHTQGVSLQGSAGSPRAACGGSVPHIGENEPRRQRKWQRRSSRKQHGSSTA